MGSDAATIIQFDGGHSTFLELPIGDVERAVTNGRLNEQELIYIQAPNKGDNGVVIDPRKVVALFASAKRPPSTV